MEYLVVSDGLEYKIATLLEVHKNHYIVALYPDLQKRKIKSEYKISSLSIINIDDFYAKAVNLSETIDSDLLAELIEDTQNKFFIHELADIYFGEKFTQVEEIALLIKLAKQNTIFNNNLNGSFNKCSPDEKLKRETIALKQLQNKLQFEKYYNNLINLEKPNFNIDILRLLTRPDKHSTEYKALLFSSKQLGLSLIELSYKVGLIDNLEKFFIDSFRFEILPKELDLVNEVPAIDLSLFEFNKEIKAFSIDDMTTTEIDDAFSVKTTATGFQIGIHIAAPAINKTLADLACKNISTIYYPGNKIPMFTPEIIQQFSLEKAKDCPVVSIYFNISMDFAIIDYFSKVEIVTIEDNLRIEELELLFNQENLQQNNDYPYENDLKILYQFSEKLEAKRGKPSVNNLQLDYNFQFIENKVIIKPRIRGNPIDKLVSELMILANCTWGRMLTNAFIPAIYRVKQTNFPVTMTLNAASHVGLNVDYYTWASSPLRRSADYFNQRQIIALVTGQKDFYQALDPILLEVVDNFDSKYAKFLEFQNKMERYWSLYYLQQESINELTGTFIFKSKVQLAGVPLEIDTQGIINPKAKGSQIKLKIHNINLANLSFDFKIIEQN